LKIIAPGQIKNCSMAAFIFAIGVFALVHCDAAESRNSANDLKLSAHGIIEGFIGFQSEIPKSPIADDAGMQRDLLEVDRKSGGLRYAVVYLMRTNRPAASVKAPTEKAAMDQQNHEFTPRVIAVQAGQPVVFSNSDPANHNVRTTASVKQNELNVFTGIDGKYEHRFVVEPEYRPVRLGCDIHPWMRGWIFIFDHPYFAVTDERGRFRFSQVPPGDYQLHIVQPDIRYREQRNLVISESATNRIETVIRQKGLRL